MEKVLSFHLTPEMLELVMFHYKTSGEHFYNHAVEDLEKGYYVNGTND